MQTPPHIYAEEDTVPLTWVKGWLSTWQAWLELAIAIPAAAVLTFRLLKKCIGTLNAAYKGGVFVMNMEEINAQRDEATKAAIEEAMNRILNKLDRLDEGQQNIIQGRRAVMEEDEQKAWFETDTGGKFIWANRLWRHMTGMESDYVRGHGWAAGVETETREETMRDWKAAFDHQRLYESTVNLVNRQGHKTAVRLTAWPLRNEADGRILSYLGHAMVLHERRRQS